MHHYKPESILKSMAWKRPTSPVTEKFKSQPSPGKIMLTIFGIWKVRFWFIPLQRVKPLTVRTIVMCYERNWSPWSKKWRGAKLVKDITKNLFSFGIKKLVKRWNRYIEVEGDYVEKWYYFRFCIFIINILFWKVLLLFDLPSYNLWICGVNTFSYDSY
jgi:hypothetical protein